MKTPLRWVSVHDIHLFHNNTPVEHTLNGLRQMFPDTAETGELDVIFVPGDMFDRAVMFNDPRIIQVAIWWREFRAMCARRKIILRVLEGTPSHEWQQSRMLEMLNTLGDIKGLDFEYVDTLRIEYIEALDIHVLYVPDEWRSDLDQVWKEVQALLQHHQLEQVDYCVMHGAFEYQLPEHVGKGITHLQSRYESITRYHILIGHVHTATFRGKVIASGSFDRLKHKEEEPKGFSKGVQYADGSFEHTFVENPHAMVYKTIRCRNSDLEATLKEIDRVCHSLPDGSFVRIEADDTHPIRNALKTLVKTYPTLHWDAKSTKNRDVDQETLIELRQNYQPMAIRPDNITEILLGRLSAEGLTTPQCDRAREILNERLARSHR